MMRPHRPFIIPLTARRDTRKAPVRLASTTSLKSSSDMRSTKPSWVIPALATSTSTGPNFSSMAEKAASTASESVTSQATGKISASTTSGGTSPRQVTATRSPRAANALAHARPIPRFPPVTSTTRLI